MPGRSDRWLVPRARRVAPRPAPPLRAIVAGLALGLVIGAPPLAFAQPARRYPPPSLVDEVTIVVAVFALSALAGALRRRRRDEDARGARREDE